ncbi:FAD dependent oxidoreductase [Niveomyces insectorum RCEF 264]|uniref:FAD dependent oxidoreductase n=1 Tax=Niveomyces insectorum RCEF 264 TaxID=1081102 RepID=A0A167M8X5_9HYPO|nr:FAD dependent oxidoreductase [Niveomyces insectorum RCEF 264]
MFERANASRGILVFCIRGEVRVSWKEAYIIIGAGIFGLSTALAIARRQPSASVTVVERLTPPVEDGTSVDTTRCIRADYGDPAYARLAAESQRLIEQDAGLCPFYHKQGMTFVCDGKPGRFFDIWQNGLDNVLRSQPAATVVKLPTPENVFASIHGTGSAVPPNEALGRPRQWNMGYCNREDAFIDARESVRVYYERCLQQPCIRFACGVPVRRIETVLSSSLPSARTAHGVRLEDGRLLTADTVLVAAGAWSNSLVDLEGLAYSSAIEVAWVKVTPDEAERWKAMSITTNLSTGFNIFPPYNGEIKMLRRSPGYCNTISMPHPEAEASAAGSSSVRISYPRTTVSHPADGFPRDAERALRDNLRELMPSLADRPFCRTKLCWLSQTSSADFIIAPHPRIRGLHLATGGSAHAWKFLPVIGDLVLDSMEGILDPVLADKWRYGKTGTDGGNAPRMQGKPQEIRDVVGSIEAQPKL